MTFPPRSNVVIFPPTIFSVNSMVFDLMKKGCGGIINSVDLFFQTSHFSWHAIIASSLRFVLIQARPFSHLASTFPEDNCNSKIQRKNNQCKPGENNFSGSLLPLTWSIIQQSCNLCRSIFSSGWLPPSWKATFIAPGAKQCEKNLLENCLFSLPLTLFLFRS